MSWAELEWPDLSPGFPEPVVTRPAPPRPDVPPDIAERVRVAERRRAVGVKLCLLAGALLCCASFTVYAAAARSFGGVAGAAGGAPSVALVLLATGLATAFPLAAVAALLLGPTWGQRRQHWRLERWQREHARWLDIQRAVYVDSLPPQRRPELLRRLRECAERAAPRSTPVPDGHSG